MPIMFAVKIDRLKVNKDDRCLTDDLDLHSRSQLRLKRDNLLPCITVVKNRHGGLVAKASAS